MEDTKYYIYNEDIKNLIECSKEEYDTYVENYEYNELLQQVYSNQITLEEIPEEKRERVNQMLIDYVAEFGEYDNQPITGDEVLNLAEEVI